LVSKLKNDPDLQGILNELGLAGKEKEFIKEKVLIYGGHHHHAGRGYVPTKEGTIPIRGMTRAGTGPVRERPVPHKMSEVMEALTAEPYEGRFDTPQILVGNALQPNIEEVPGVYKTYQRLLHDAQVLGARAVESSGPEESAG
jgi:hypothetical protein